MNRDTSLNTDTETARVCGFRGTDVSDMPSARPRPGLPPHQRRRVEGGSVTGGDAGYGTWTEAFERLHAAALAGAPPEELERLAAAELDQLTELDQRHEQPERGRVR